MVRLAATSPRRRNPDVVLRGLSSSVMTLITQDVVGRNTAVSLSVSSF